MYIDVPEKCATFLDHPVDIKYYIVIDNMVFFKAMRSF